MRMSDWSSDVCSSYLAYLHAGQVTVIQNNIVLDQTMDLVRAAIPHMGEEALREMRGMLQKKLPPTNADNAPGLVPNMMTGRIANRLDLRGPNYVLDAACASPLDRKSVGKGKSVAVRVDIGGRRLI